MTAMKEAHVHADSSVAIVDQLILKIFHPFQILIKVVVSGAVGLQLIIVYLIFKR